MLHMLAHDHSLSLTHTHMHTLLLLLLLPHSYVYRRCTGPIMCPRHARLANCTPSWHAASPMHRLQSLAGQQPTNTESALPLLLQLCPHLHAELLLLVAMMMLPLPLVTSLALLVRPRSLPSMEW